MFETLKSLKRSDNYENGDGYLDSTKLYNLLRNITHTKKAKIFMIVLPLSILLAISAFYIVRKEISLSGLDKMGIQCSENSLFQNVEQGNYEVVKLLLNAGVNVNCKTDAYKSDFLEVGMKRDLNSSESINETPLMVACLKKQPDIVNLLISKGADVNLSVPHEGGVYGHPISGLDFAVKNGDALSVVIILDEKPYKELIEGPLSTARYMLLNKIAWFGFDPKNYGPNDTISDILEDYQKKVDPKSNNK